MEPLVFIVVAVALYVVSDWLLDRLEAAWGGRLEHRSLIFFVILLALALATFPVLERLFGG